MANKHITLPIDPDRLKDERTRNQFVELFGSAALSKALDPDAESGVYDFTSEEIQKMSDTEYTRRQDEILSAMEKNRIKK